MGSIDLPYDGRKIHVNAPDDATLVALTIEEGPTAFGEIVKRYKDAVFGVALSRLRNFHDAEDLTQTTFVEAFDRLDRLKDPTGLGPWLRTIAINRSINFLKRRERVVDFEAIGEPVSEEPSPQADVEKSELREQVMNAVGQLSKTQRETVTLYYISEYSLAEVAAIQDVPLGTIKRRLHEARKKLKEGMIEMVEDVLKDNAPDEHMADNVFGLLNSYPSGSRLYNRSIRESLEKIGEAGQEGFVRALDLPHWRSRLMVVHYLGQRYQQGGPPKELTLDLLKKSLQDSNRGVRMKAARSLLGGSFKLEPDVYVKEVVPLVTELLFDSSVRVRHSTLFWLGWWAKKFSESNAQVREALPLNRVCQAMVQEQDPKNLKRFQWLISIIIDAEKN